MSEIHRGPVKSPHKGPVTRKMLPFDDVIMSTVKLGTYTKNSWAWRLDGGAQIKGNIKAPRHWPLCGEITGTGEFPAQVASNAENVSMSWCHHVMIKVTGGYFASDLSHCWIEGWVFAWLPQTITWTDVLSLAWFQGSAAFVETYHRK